LLDDFYLFKGAQEHRIGQEGLGQVFDEIVLLSRGDGQCAQLLDEGHVAIDRDIRPSESLLGPAEAAS
jgi:hypothetical protein